MVSRIPSMTLRLSRNRSSVDPVKVVVPVGPFDRDRFRDARLHLARDSLDVLARWLRIGQLDHLEIPRFGCEHIARFHQDSVGLGHQGEAEPLSPAVGIHLAELLRFGGQPGNQGGLLAGHHPPPSLQNVPLVRGIGVLGLKYIFPT